MKKVKTSRNMVSRPTTTRDVMNRMVPAPTSGNIRRGHLVRGMRDVNHIEWESWEGDTTEYLRMVERSRLDRANRFYNAMDRVQTLFSEVRHRSGELQAAYEEMQATNEELQSTNEELQATTDELERTSAYRQTLMDSMLDVLMTTNTEGVITEVNRATELISGYTAEELVGKPLSDFFTEPERAEAGIKQVLAEKEVSNYELTLVTKDGLEVPVSYNATVLQDRKGRITGVLGSARNVTEQKQAEEALNRLAAIVKYSDDAIIGKTLNGVILSWNKGAERMYGYTEEEAMGENISLLAPPGHLDELSELLKKIGEGESVEHFETIRVRKDGKQIHVSLTLSPIKGASGKITGVSTISHNITERKQAEEVTKRASMELNQIFNTAADGMRVIDNDFNILRANETFLKMVNLTENEVVGAKCYEILSSPLCNTDNCPLTHLRAGDERVVSETEMVRGDGTKTVCILSATSFLDLAGSVIGIVEDIRDITDRKEAEEELRVASAYNRSLIEASLDPLVTIGTDGKIMDLNAATEAVTGYSRDELTGTDFSNYFTEPENARAGYQRAFETGTVQDYELEIQHRDGSVTPVLYNAAVYRNEAGKVKGVFAAARDIEKQKHADSILKQTLDRLESSNKELEQFAYVASHDLQEPLRMVSSYTQLLEKRYKDKLDSDADEFIGYVVGGVSRMQNLINSLLTYSRVATKGKAFAKTDCEAVLATTITNLKKAIEESSAGITHDPLPAVMADDVQLGQVFQNLIGNAIKFRGKNNPRIHVSAEQKDAEWVFSVRDNGVGIEPQYHDRIFQLYQQLHTKDEYPGTGIGLTICKKIVERHGGRVWVKSKPGKGSTFFFTLPTRGSARTGR
jgi:PAS domain S-box-containing protein